MYPNREESPLPEKETKGPTTACSLQGAWNHNPWLAKRPGEARLGAIEDMPDKLWISTQPNLHTSACACLYGSDGNAMHTTMCANTLCVTWHLHQSQSCQAKGAKDTKWCTPHERRAICTCVYANFVCQQGHAKHTKECTPRGE